MRTCDLALAFDAFAFLVILAFAVDTAVFLASVLVLAIYVALVGILLNPASALRPFARAPALKVSPVQSHFPLLHLAVQLGPT